MKPILRRSMTVWFALSSVATGFGHCVAAISSETAPKVTIHVRNYARVDSQTLSQAELVTSGIFRKAGVETRWVDMALTVGSDTIDSAGRSTFTPGDIQLDICPDFMANRFNLPEDVMGLAPGAGLNRGAIYVFDGKVTALTWTIVTSNSRREVSWFITKGQVLGHAIAHELGHLLLNQQGHSSVGIMRGKWGYGEMRDASRGELLFTPQQAGTIQIEVRRREIQLESQE
jgi:hypothetical protein